MDILIRHATIVDPASPHHLQNADLLLRDGHISRLAPSLTETAAQVIDLEGLHLSPGWIDLFAHFCDPGQEQRETIGTGTAAAAAGGYTDVLLVPNTAPCAHNKSTIEYIRAKGAASPVQVHPLGAISKNTEGKELAEMYDMHAAGAPAFTDGWNPVQSGGLMMKALQYVRAIDVPLIQVPDDRSFNPGGLMHEGIVSTQLGLPGRPALAEELMIARDIELVRYTGARLHFTGISTARSVALIRAAKAEGLPVSCSVTPLHLLYTEDDLRSYDTNLKLVPPLRTAADRDALCEGLRDGSIDCVAAHHLPQDTDHKIVEFEYAGPGAIGLQTTFGALRTALPELDVTQLCALLGANARRLFGLPPFPIREGAPARLTLFVPDATWSFMEAANRSRSANSPFFGKALTGQPAGIITTGGVFLNTF
ncbi:dihydroorotase [Flaviaesturariibacter amylovorans]|uniref:Dihydroorotase n=1 Tax=Flaviaesturariibacter amylovorans TaxID=1084520 RepID=A0ABP8GSK4_9BACT